MSNYDRQNGNSSYYNGYNNTRNVSETKKVFNPNIDWFNKAKEVIVKEKDRRGGTITANQLRNLLSVLINVKNEFDRVNANELTKEQLDKLRYAKVKIIYQVAREGNNDFYNETQIEEKIENVKNKKDFDDLIKYVEAIVAYHKYFIKK